MPTLDELSAPPLRLHMVGRPRLTVAGDERVISSAKQMLLLARLARSRDRAASRAQLAAFLWPGNPPASARTNLRQALTRLRAAIDAVEDPITVQADLVALAKDRWTTDLDDMGRAIEQTESLVFLDGIDSGEPEIQEWIETERRAVATEIERAAIEYLQRLDRADAITVGLRLVALNPLNEDAHLRLMELYVASGKRARALEMFETLRKRLDKEIGEAPMVEIRRLASSIRRADGQLTHAPPIMRNDGVGPERRRIVVLPFTNISADPENVYFADGLTEELISRLSRVGELGVIARTSAMQYRATDKGIDQIGRELSVGTVLEGSVRQAGDRVRITAQLIDVASQEHLWSADYDRDLVDVFAIQSEISQAVAKALISALVPDRKSASMATGTQNMEVYGLYLKGRYLLLNERNINGHQQAIRYLEQALAMDSEFAPAYASLADLYGHGPFIRFQSPSEAYPKAKEMAERAIAIDPENADAWYALATAEIEYFWNWEAGERAVKRALEIDPNHVLAMSVYGHRLLSTVYGRYKDAIATMERSLALDPLSLQAHIRFGLVLWHAGMLDRSIEQLRETIATWPSATMSRLGLGWAYCAKGLYEEAVEQMLIAAELSNRSSYALGFLAAAHAGAGRRDEALALVAELEQRARTSQVSAAAFVPAYASLGNGDRLMDVLDQMYQERHPEIVFMRINDWLDPFRADERFVALMKRVGFPADR